MHLKLPAFALETMSSQKNGNNINANNANNNQQNNNRARPASEGTRPGPESPTEGPRRRFFIPQFHEPGESYAERLFRFFEFTMHLEGRRAICQRRHTDAFEENESLRDELDVLGRDLGRCERNLDRSQRNLRRAETRIVELEGQIEVLSSDTADDEDPADVTYQPPSLITISNLKK